MSTLTKEWLLKTIAELEEERDATPGAVNEDAARALAAMKLALASLEAEPVTNEIVIPEPATHRNINEICPPGVNQTLFASGWNASRKSGMNSGRIPPIVKGIDAECVGWNACRAAMLQGADGKSPVIPDGLRLALSNAGIATPESDEMLAATCEEYIQTLVTWVKERKPFRSAVIPGGWVACSERMPDDTVDADGGATCYLVFYAEGRQPNGGSNVQVSNVTYLRRWHEGMITHWMPLPAAPQQEVK
ncbi:DUF551 domain-containing protein [Enterobacter hormaechei]|uniref:DUF551 domain-containing protein n=1 Tax=Enterobacter hormaechei TaxID=158836 RepID=UPI000796B2E9|nr:DUF551 domain-containing protein [Enterobacter hormaechei]MBK4253978.1 DUF551 domain-containing protein [Enterobacter hormaechei]MBK4443765.1 DUF551 domain-containing protein [Enterobacter hormaechei]MBK4447677.1 DUF551 domain-containing protein [Enterobacter hormaechei]MBK4508208.1 DUF551 domain-containing protein [Enterobacter hormaechei]MBK4523994.1 DUF551 domain-containing protein [Enterobacter hormaechei]